MKLILKLSKAKQSVEMMKFERRFDILKCT